MRDTFGRNISYLRLSVTDLCNYRCTYCMPADGVCKMEHREILSIEELLEIARASVDCGISKIRVTGGEPLVRKGIVELVRGLASIEGVKELAMTTNGSLLEEMAAELKDAGLDRLNISLDTLRSERYAEITRRGRLEKFLAGVEAAEKAGFTNTKINTVLIGGVNDDEVRSIASLTMDRDVSVRFIELMPMGECSDWDKSRFLPIDTVLDIMPELEALEQDGVARLFRLPGAKGTVGLISPISHRFCSQCNRIRVTADGKLKPCLHSDTEIPLRGLHGEELVNRIAQSIGLKPQQHELVDLSPSKTHRSMNQIGG